MTIDKENNMIVGTIVRVNGEVEEFLYNGFYPELGKIVGGYIEAVNFGDKPYFCYINEEGKFLELKENVVATALWYNSGQRVLLGDYIAGDVIFFGQVDDEGNNNPSTLSIANDVQKDMDINQIQNNNSYYFY
jgi:hypothetical protein